jgi:soluble lytic murein transglycosylase
LRRFWLGASVVWLVCVSALGEAGLERVASLVRTGDVEGALAAIAELPTEAQDDDSLRYLKGRLLLAVGRPCDAMEALAQTPGSLPDAMRADSTRRWARAAARCGHCDEARPVLLAAASSEVAVTRRDRAVAADCAVQMGELETAVEELSRLTRRNGGLENRVALLALLSDVYAELGRPDDARKTALDAWQAAVHPGEQRAARKLEERAAPTMADRIARAEELMAARRFERAVEELEAIEVGDDADLKARWHHAYGMALFRMRTRYLDAARVLHQSALLGGPHEAEDAFHSARALSRADKDARAIRAYRRFAVRYPKNRRASEARFLAAWLEIRLGRASGEKQMERLVRGKSQVRGRWRRSALWELGFRAFETRRYARAAHYLAQYTQLATTSMDQARGHYWQGRAHRRGPKAVDAYREAVGVEPLHWYAVLAANRLKRLGVEPPKPFENASSPSSVEVPEAFLPIPETFESYRRLGLDVDGIAWLTAHENSLVGEFPKAQRIPLLARLYRDADAYREALRTARRRMVFLRSDPEEHRWWWDAAYPMPWLDTVDAHRGKLPRSLVYATMRQESGFQPEVVSRAGAVGLMQVMPELATKLTGEQITRHVLRDPETNIALGLREMTALADELDHVYPLSIAAYNAGKRRVRRWLKESGKMELDRFVERIPFNETRNYVRRVSTHYARYSYLDESESGWPRLPRFVNP